MAESRPGLNPAYQRATRVPPATGRRLSRRGHPAGLDVADGQLIDVVTAQDVGDEVPRGSDAERIWIRCPIPPGHHARHDDQQDRDGHRERAIALDTTPRPPMISAISASDRSR
jgi:hypothetical protein